MTEPVVQGQDRTSGVRVVKSADRILALLEYLTGAGEAKSVRNVSDDLGIPRASAYALLMTLRHRGWVEATDNRFRLGLGALRAAAAVIEVDETVHATQLVRQRLASELRETVHLARLDGPDVVYLQSMISPQSLSVVSRPGRRLAAWVSALGKMLLAERSWEAVSALLPERLEAITPHSITSKSELRAELELTAQRHYAIDNEENTIGLRCFAIAVPMVTPPVYAISVSVPTPRLDDRTETKIIKSLLRTRDELLGR